MELLVSTSSAVYGSLMQGFIVLRRSDSYWSDVCFNFFIKQVFMWSIKLGGGITRGCDFNNSNSTE